MPYACCLKKVIIVNFLLTALALGCVSMFIVFFAGLNSGVVRLGTLAIRTVFAFAMTSAATYFLLMLYDYYEEIQAKKLKKDVEEIVTEESVAETSDKNAAEQSQNNVEGFQPMNAENLPNVGK